MWERWNSIMPDGSFGPVEMNSFNHYAYGVVGDWMFQNIGGLSAIGHGYKRSRIAPASGGNLTQGSGSLKTVYSLLSSRWNADHSGFGLRVTVPTVPVNRVAEVHVPSENRWAVTEGAGRRRQGSAVPPDRARDRRVRGWIAVLQIQRRQQCRPPGPGRKAAGHAFSTGRLRRAGRNDHHVN